MQTSSVDSGKPQLDPKASASPAGGEDISVHRSSESQIHSQAQNSSVLPAFKLNDEEVEQFAQCQSVIASGWNTFVSVGRALLTIRDRRLYRETHPTFEAYCRQQCAFSKSHANRLISAAQVVDCLAPIGVNIETESQARPLASLPPDKIQAAGRRALDLAGMGKITARHTRAAAREFLPHPRPQIAARKNKRKTAMEFIAAAERAANQKNSRLVIQILVKLRRTLW